MTSVPDYNQLCVDNQKACAAMTVDIEAVNHLLQLLSTLKDIGLDKVLSNG